MARCHTCGNDYDKTMDVSYEGSSYTFDSFECAIHALAPECAHCGCRVIGHGTEQDGAIFCCGHCAEGNTRSAGGAGASDRSHGAHT